MDTTTPQPDPTTGPTFTVVIPTFRRPALVAEAVASVVGQTRTAWECLVVDDGGGDDLDPVAAGDPRVRILRRLVPGGPAAARNAGIAEARGSIITFLDDDDRYRPDRLELAERGLADPQVGVTVCWTRWFDGDASGPEAPSTPPDGTDAAGRRLEGDVSDCVLDATTPHLGGTAVRAAALLRFDERFRATEDVEWWLRTAGRSLVSTVPRVGCELRRHTGARANGTDVAGRLASGRLLLDVHHDYFAAHPRAEAFRLARLGMLASAGGDRSEARRLLLRSLRRRPSGLAARAVLRTVRT